MSARTSDLIFWSIVKWLFGLNLIVWVVILLTQLECGGWLRLGVLLCK